MSYRDSGSIEIIIYAEDYNSIVKKRVIKSIRNSKLSDNGYFWINEIIDFDGGDNYAIRLVHPNLIETEGNYLSTNFKDNHGNQPYLTELNGIKSDGYVLFDYYFKKLNSSKVSHKLSYSKLYKPFNWVVATGIYLDDVDEFISNEKNIMETSLRRIRVASVFAILIAILICGIIVWFFEKVISTMIKEFNLDINKAYKKLEVIAYKDTLSGLLNRRSMAHHMDEELSRASRNNTYFGIIMLDIDHFKNINDTYGHDIGDIVIQKVSQVLKNTCRSEDKLSRWGGEEFLILAISPNIENLISMAEKIRVAISELKIPVNKEEISVSATFGLSYYNGNKNIKELIKEADDNLYIGKKSGRNRVVS
ncbi:sensor domain-containing diguanylate cyclase [Thiospirochaeta perfilievii]|uniref:diguanylate cyclase n=1 Tax=Thiospirochaeta perfilievii TaxID=252967 RepID=A0A5C1Q6M9_9SPIO|nr:sensor domain-containing diguanylate cyclase [Thiospirochaeta perfilievii]QEN03645.1 sensor domain-containing diguanylate cyclase [Thiospirochaeta perfilievii]